MSAKPTENSNSADISLLMATYAGDDPEHLLMAFNSILRQTVRCKEIVLVVDGPVSTAHEVVIAQAAADFGEEYFQVVRLEENVGIGAAIDYGLSRCSHNIVARMDADDVSELDRFEQQWSVMQGEPDIVLVGSWEADFQEDPNIISALKIAPEHHDSLLKSLRWRCVIPNPSIMFRRDSAIAVGGYRDLRIFEDWDFFLRISRVGKLKVLQTPLIRVRVTLDQRKRRGGRRVFVDLCRLRWGCYGRGDYGFGVMFLGLLLWIPIIFMPNRLRNMMYVFTRRTAN